MKFHRLSEIPPRDDDLVCKAPTAGAFLGPILYSGIGLALLLRGIRGGVIYGLGMPTGVVCYGGALVFGLLGWAAWRNFRARSKSTNWLMRCNSSGILIKYRSFLNWPLSAEDVQVVEINYSEIAEVRESREERNCTFAGDGYAKYLAFLEICLANADTSALEAHLEAERTAKGPSRIKTKWLEVGTGRCLDYPVEVSPGGIVRVRWKESAMYGTTPSVTKTIAYLSQYIKAAASVSKEVDLTPLRSLSPEEADRNILKLAQSGDKMGAVKSTRVIYGCSLSEAVAYVESLQSKGR